MLFSCCALGTEPVPDHPTRTPVTPGLAGQFLLEVAGLIGIGRLGWYLGEEPAMSLALAALFVALAGAGWGLFRTRGFVPNGRDPIVAIPGPARLALEVGFFVLASGGLWVSGGRVTGVVLLTCTILIYWVLRERTIGLLRNGPPAT